MAIKFDNGANPSKVMWKSSPSATEQEAYAIKYNGEWVWAKPYTLVRAPSVGTVLSTSGSGASAWRLSGKSMTDSFDLYSSNRKRDTIFIQSNNNDIDLGECCTIGLPDGGSLFLSLIKPQGGYPGNYEDGYGEVLSNDSGSAQSVIVCFDDGDDYDNPEWRYENIFTARASSRAVKIFSFGPTYGSVVIGGSTGYYNYYCDETFTTKQNYKYGIGIIVQVEGKLPANPNAGITTDLEGTYQMMVWFAINDNYLTDYEDLRLDRIYIPIRTNVDGSNATMGFIPKGSTSGYLLKFSSWSGNTLNCQYGSTSRYASFTFNFTKKFTVTSASSLKRVRKIEPTAVINEQIYKGSTVYWGDLLKLYDANNQALSEWTIDSTISNNSNVLINYSKIVPLSWDTAYQAGNSFVFGLPYTAYTYIFAEEEYYLNHKTKKTKTTQAFTNTDVFNYTADSSWAKLTTEFDQQSCGTRFSNTVVESRSIPSSITTPTITVTDLGSTYVNIKVVNNSSYAGSYYLSFKAYHSVGNPVSYTYSGSIGANSTTIPTINISSYSSQGPIKGIAGTGQIYYLGKGSGTASFSRGDTGGNSGGGDVCLIKNTPILMADNTTKPIQDIVVGDEILGYDFENNCTTPSVVMYSIPTKFQQQAHYIIFDNGKTLCTTRGHELYVVEYGRYVPVEDIKEGEHCLDENGNETEVLAIHWDVELKTFEQFYHIISSNNTYYANGILNAGVPIDKYRYIHDLRGENISEEVEELIMDESKDTACFNFTVTNPEFIQKGTPFQSQIKKSRNRVWELEKLIAKLDEKIARVAAGLGLDDEYEKLKAKYYKEMAELQEKMVNWESDYNQLLAQYSDIGEDILLEDQERRRKYFRRANKIANDNFAVYKANYVRDPAPKDLGEGVELVRVEDDYLK